VVNPANVTNPIQLTQDPLVQWYLQSIGSAPPQQRNGLLTLFSEDGTVQANLTLTGRGSSP
jgi:hypothetical protein